MNKSFEELESKPFYRATTFLSGDLKRKFLNECKTGKKPAKILKQALKEYYNKT